MKITHNAPENVSPTILAGYYKFGTATLIGGGYGTTGASVIELYETSDIRDGGRNSTLRDSGDGRCQFASHTGKADGQAIQYDSNHRGV